MADKWAILHQDFMRINDPSILEAEVQLNELNIDFVTKSDMQTIERFHLYYRRNAMNQVDVFVSDVKLAQLTALFGKNKKAITQAILDAVTEHANGTMLSINYITQVAHINERRKHVIDDASHIDIYYDQSTPASHLNLRRHSLQDYFPLAQVDEGNRMHLIPWTTARRYFNHQQERLNQSASELENQADLNSQVMRAMEVFFPHWEWQSRRTHIISPHENQTLIKQLNNEYYYKRGAALIDGNQASMRMHREIDIILPHEALALNSIVLWSHNGYLKKPLSPASMLGTIAHELTHFYIKPKYGESVIQVHLRAELANIMMFRLLKQNATFMDFMVERESTSLKSAEAFAQLLQQTSKDYLLFLQYIWQQLDINQFSDSNFAVTFKTVYALLIEQYGTMQQKNSLLEDTALE